MKPLNNRLVRTLWGGLISLPFPGLGHILARRWTFGAGLLGLMLVGGVALGYMMDGLAPTPANAKIAVALMGFGFLVAGLSALDAMRLLWRTDRPPAPDWRRSTWLAGLVAFVVTGATSLAYDQDWKSYSTPSTSMAPTLEIGDYFFADLRPFAPRRGDVVVFRKPGDHNTVYIKRIVGLPGDTVEVHDAAVYINGEKLTEDFPHNYIPPGEFMPPVTVGDGQLFVMGDNRPNSSDSRVFGPISQDLAVGKAWLRIWPLNKFGIVEHEDLDLPAPATAPATQ